VTKSITDKSGQQPTKPNHMFIIQCSIQF